MTKQEIGQILRAARESKGLTQKQVAEFIGRKQQIVGHWETGYSQPDANTLFELCDLYDLSIDEAFGKKTDSIATENTMRTDTITEEALTFAKTFDSLDAPGKAAVTAVLETQQQRIREYGRLEKKPGISIRLPLIQGTHEADVQMRYQSKREQQELHQSETLQSDPT